MRNTLRSVSKRQNDNQRKTNKALRRACRGIVPIFSGLESLEDRRMLSLPPGWSNMDIGGPATAGSSDFTGTGTGDSPSGTFTIVGGGGDIWGTANQFQYAYRTDTPASPDTGILHGDGTIQVQIDSLAKTAANTGTLHEWAKAGIVLNSTVTPANAAGAINVDWLYSVGVDGTGNTHDVTLQWRSTQGGGEASTYNGVVGNNRLKAPQKLQLVRQGNTFIAYTWNPTTSAWVEYKRTTVGAMPADLYVGLGVTSHDNAANHTVQATFEGFSISNRVTTALPVNAPMNFTVTTAAGTPWKSVLSWTDNSWNETGYKVFRSADYNPATGAGNWQAFSLPADTQSWTDPDIAAGQSYYYKVEAYNDTSVGDSQIIGRVDYGQVNGSIVQVYGKNYGSQWSWGSTLQGYIGLESQVNKGWNGGGIGTYNNWTNVRGDNMTTRWTGQFRVPLINLPTAVQNPTGDGAWSIQGRTDDDGWLYVDGLLASKDPGGHGVQVPANVYPFGPNTGGNPDLAMGSWHDYVLYENQQGGGGGAQLWVVYSYTDASGTRQTIYSSLVPAVDLRAPMTALAAAYAPQSVSVDTWTAPGQNIVSWTIPTDRQTVQAYVIQRSDNGGAFTTIATLPFESTSYFDQNILPNHTYTYQVCAAIMTSAADGSALDFNQYSLTPSAPSAPVTVPASNPLQGLQGMYFTNWSRTDLPWAPVNNKEVWAPGRWIFSNARVDPQLNYNFNGPTQWGGTGPDVLNTNWGRNPGFPDARPAGLNSEYWLGLWQGTFVPQQDGIYTIGASSDDAVRIWVNGVLMINNWGGGGVTYPGGTTTPQRTSDNPGASGMGRTIPLQANVPVPIVVAFDQGTGGEGLFLFTKVDTGAWNIIPPSELLPTIAAPVASVINGASNIGPFTATLNFTKKSKVDLFERLEYSTDNGTTWSVYKRYSAIDNSGAWPSMIDNPNGDNTVSINLTGLTPLTAYQFRMVDGNVKLDTNGQPLSQEVLSNVINFTTGVGKGGVLKVAATPNVSGNVDLTAEGKLDWAGYGYATNTMHNAGTWILPDPSILGGATKSTITTGTGAPTFSWTSGISTNSTAADVTTTTTTIVALPGPDCPSGQFPVQAIANDVGGNNTKYLNYEKANTGFIVTLPAAKIVNGFRYATGGDAEGRDPTSFIIYGSNDGTTFTEISRQDMSHTGSRNSWRPYYYFRNNTAYTQYKVIFPYVYSNGENSMQINEFELMNDTNGVVASGGDKKAFQFAGNAGAGFELAVPAGAAGTKQTLNLYVSATNTAAKLHTWLGDLSADTVDTVFDATGTTKYYKYTFTFNNDPTVPNQKLFVDLTTLSNGGSVALLAADLVDAQAPNTPAGLTVGNAVGAGNAASSYAMLRWGDTAANESGFKIERSADAGATWSAIANIQSNATSYRDFTVSPNTAYQYRISAVNTAGASALAGPVSITTRSFDAPGWQHQDIGGVNYAGDAWTDPTQVGVYTLQASGRDIWNNSDEAQFMYQKFTGTTDFVIEARVVSNFGVLNGNPGNWDKPGIDIRQATTGVNQPLAGASHVIVADTFAQNRVLQWRDVSGTAGALGLGQGAASSGTNPAGVAFTPYFLRLVKAGNVFTAYQSPDGITWTAFSTTADGSPHTVANFGNDFYAGLMLDSADNTKIAQASFSNVQMTNLDTGAPLVPILTAAYPAKQLDGTYQIALTWSQPAEIDQANPKVSFGVYRSIDGTSNYQLISTLPPGGGTTYTDTLTGVPNPASHNYYYKVVATNTAVAVNPPTATSNVVRSNPLGGLSATYYGGVAGATAAPPDFTGRSYTVAWADQNNNGLWGADLAAFGHNWGGDTGTALYDSVGSPLVASKYFSTRWTGYLQPDVTDAYTLFTNSDDASRLYIDLLDGKGMRQWANSYYNVQDRTNAQYDANNNIIAGTLVTANLTAGTKYPIRVEYAQGAGGTWEIARWQTATMARQNIPAANLLPMDILPAKPTLLSLTPNTNSATFIFDDNAINEDATRIEVQVGSSWVPFSDTVSAIDPTRINDGWWGPIQNLQGQPTRINTSLNLTPGTSYTFRVAAVNGAGLSASDPATIVIPPAVPSGSIGGSPTVLTSMTNVNLTTDGNLGWAHWGYINDITVYPPFTSYERGPRQIVSNLDPANTTAIPTPTTATNLSMSWSNWSAGTGLNVLGAMDTIVGFPTTAPAGQTVPWPGYPANGGAGTEGPSNVLDSASNTKYLNFNKLNTGVIITPAAGSTVVTGIGLVSANDAPERDPSSYVLEGSNDGGNTWTQVSAGLVALFTARFQEQDIAFTNSTPYSMYRVTFPTVANAAAANSMQIADIKLLKTPYGAPSATTSTGISGQNGSLVFTVPAVPVMRRLKVYVGAEGGAILNFTAALNDTMPLTYTDSSLASPMNGGGTFDPIEGVYTIDYNSVQASSMVTITLMNSGFQGSIDLFGVSVTELYPPATPANVKVLPGLSRTNTIVWSDLSTNEDGFQIERSSDGGTTWQIAANVGPNVTSFRDSNLTPGQTYQYHVIATAGISGSLNSAPSPASDPVTMGAIDPAWQVTDVGGPALPGDLSWDNSNPANPVWTTVADGNDIWNNSDQMEYIYQPLNGDGGLTLRVGAQQRSDAWAKTGIDIRENLTGGSKHVLLAVTPDNGVVLQGRPVADAASAWWATTAGAAAPYFLRLTRTGDLFRAYSSLDGVAWSYMGSVSVPMNANAYIGIAATSHNAGTLGKNTIDSVDLTNPAITLAPIAPVTLTAPYRGNNVVYLRWNALAASDTTYTVLRNGTPLASASNITRTDWWDETAQDGQTYHYVVTTTNGAGQTTTSADLVLTPQDVKYDTGFASTDGLSILGASHWAIAPDGRPVMRVTDAVNGLIGGFWAIDRKDVTKFRTSFDLQVVSGNPADGFAFVIQNGDGTRDARTYLGGDGGGSLGYFRNDLTQPAWYPKSVALRFRTWSDGAGPASVGLYHNGYFDLPHAYPVKVSYQDAPLQAIVPVNIRNANYKRVTLDYSGTTLKMSILDLSTLDEFDYVYNNVDIPAAVGGNTAIVGVVGATGGANATQDIRAFSFVNPVDLTGNNISVRVDGANVKYKVDANPEVSVPLEQIGAVTLTGAPGADTFNLDLSGGNPFPYGVTVTGSTGGSNVLNLKGTAGDDVFAVSGSSVAVGAVNIPFSNVGQVNLDGLGGNNSVAINGTPNVDTFGVGAAGITLNSLAIGLTSIGGGTALNGRAGNDIVNIDATTALPAGLTIDGGLDSDTVSFKAGADATFNINSTGVSLVGGSSLAFSAMSNVESLKVVGSAGNDVFNVDAGSALPTLLSITLDGAGGSNSANFSGSANADTISIATNSVVVNGASFTLANIGGGVAINSLGGDDTINVDAAATLPAGLAIDGGAGNDTVKYNGTANADTFSVNATSVSLTGGNSLAYSILSNIESLSVLGAAGDDTFNVDLTASMPSAPVVAIDGGAGTNSLNIAGTANGDAFTVSAGNAALGSVGMNFANIAKVNVDGLGGSNTLTVNGAAGDDTIGVGAGVTLGSLAINLTNIGGTTVNGLDGNDSFNVDATAVLPAGLKLDGGNGTNTVNHNGTANADTFSITGAAISLTGGNTLAYSQLASIQNLVVAGAAGSDIFDVDGTANLPAGLKLDGGAGADTNVVNYTGTANADTFNANATQVALAGGNTLAFSALANIASVTMTGLGGDDSFNVDFGTALPATPALKVNGGNLDGTAAGNDIIYPLNPKGTIVDSGTSITDGTSTVAYINAKMASLIGPVTVSGASGDDQIYVKQAGGNVEWWINHDPAVTPVPDGKAALASIDKLTVAGLDGNDTITLDVSGGALSTNGIIIDGGDVLILKGLSGDVDLAASPAIVGPDKILSIAGVQKVGMGDGSVHVVSLPAGMGLVATGTATVDLTSSMTVPTLDVTGGGKVVLAANGGRTLTIGPNATAASVNISGNGMLEINDNGLILQAANATDRDALLGVLTGLIKSARGTNGAWAGTTGVLSSSAKADYAANNQAFTTGIAVTSNIKLDANGNVIGALKTTFKGQTVDQNAVLAAYSFNGDTNLDGVITFDDYFKINTGFLSNGTLGGYQNGDFTFDGLINFDDYFLINTAFLGQGSKSLPSMSKSVAPFSTTPLNSSTKITRLVAKKAAKHHHRRK